MIKFKTHVLTRYFYHIATELESLLSFTFVPFFFKEAERERVRERAQARKRERSWGEEKVGRQSIKQISPSSKNS